MEPIALFDLEVLPTAAGIFDVAVFALAVFYVAFASLAWASRNADSIEDPERELAVSAVGTFITVNIASSSVLLVGVSALIGLGFGSEPVTPTVFTQLTLASLWLVASLSFGAISAGYIVNHVHHAKSVAENSLVMTTATGQMISNVCGGIFLATAFFLF